MNSLLFFGLLMFVAGICSGHKPHPCRTPPLLSGSLSVSAKEGQNWAVAKYRYDAFGQRIRLWEFGKYDDKSFHLNMLFLFREGVVYTISYRNKTCQKNLLNTTFHPSEIPRNASLMSQVVLGGSSGPGEGLLVNTWTGVVPETQGKYLATVTEFGCIPVSMLYYTAETGWVVTSYFNAVTGIEDPDDLNPPSFCTGIQTEEEKLNFFSAFF
ncbi:ependymin-like 1 [Misgurnus anguillicaudatus]|uniref:ependymin-like 1 n=1 Tax=Misgurnus anguillicaudatus TaxID=75329 RepID=UPI0024358D19|nr:ependymin-like 1 [Misgurnus anguillicaudatus]